MARYLVTGAAGFIGSSLVRALLQRGEKVRGIDNFSTGQRHNIEEIRGRMDFLEGDLLDGEALRAACQNVDFVLHHAAIPSVPRSVADPLENNRANLDATVQLLAAARQAGVRRVVYAGSSSAYGDGPASPKRETLPPSPLSPYAVAKLAGEYYMHAFWQCYGLETVCLRYFNIFGPRQDPTSPYSGVLARFIQQMIRNEPPTIFGDGTQSRDFTFVDNVVEANLLACSATASAVAGRVFNVATGVARDLNEVVVLLREILQYRGEVRRGPERIGDVKHSVADLTCAEKSLGYKAIVDFEEGLRRTVEWYCQTHAASPSN